ncbi:MAG TPA: hypothetical protein VJ201_05080 [Candidatus Babeliales bacterium]|nr:hypothetical protein [Candidatus Babeliales bacterium]
MQDGDIEKLETILRRYAVQGIRVNDNVVEDIRKETSLTRVEIIKILFEMGVLIRGSR